LERGSAHSALSGGLLYPSCQRLSSAPERSIHQNARACPGWGGSTRPYNHTHKNPGLNRLYCGGVSECTQNAPCRHHEEEPRKKEFLCPLGEGRTKRRLAHHTLSLKSCVVAACRRPPIPPMACAMGCPFSFFRTKSTSIWLVRPQHPHQHLHLTHIQTRERGLACLGQKHEASEGLLLRRLSFVRAWPCPRVRGASCPKQASPRECGVVRMLGTNEPNGLKYFCLRLCLFGILPSFPARPTDRA